MKHRKDGPSVFELVLPVFLIAFGVGMLVALSFYRSYFIVVALLIGAGIILLKNNF